MSIVDTSQLLKSDFGRIKRKDLMLQEYKYLYDNMRLVIPARKVTDVVSKLKFNQDRYEKIAAKIKWCHWVIVATLHFMESNCNFNTNLLNGDPITDRTIRYPAGRPKEGQPPFTFEYCAYDALKPWFENYTKFLSIYEMLYFLEMWNGFGNRKINYKVNLMGYETQPLSPYLWSGTNLYIKGKFIADGKYDPEAVSKQIGAAVILSRLI